ncbi:hypothetical protein EGW08_016206 [Elysia chlorotica]|uniref:Uncharacterized protein n=1 Tax=Elysia chlorotica TaxID=188477 RepID=A0A3S1B4R4_ELYCH|nr:hypothetical protein EGW08_016206 [Elysia chlorotica]
MEGSVRNWLLISSIPAAQSSDRVNQFNRKAHQKVLEVPRRENPGSKRTSPLVSTVQAELLPGKKEKAKEIWMLSHREARRVGQVPLLQAPPGFPRRRFQRLPKPGDVPGATQRQYGDTRISGSVHYIIPTPMLSLMHLGPSKDLCPRGPKCSSRHSPHNARVDRLRQCNVPSAQCPLSAMSPSVQCPLSAMSPQRNVPLSAMSPQRSCREQGKQGMPIRTLFLPRDSGFFLPAHRLGRKTLRYSPRGVNVTHHFVDDIVLGPISSRLTVIC